MPRVLRIINRLNLGGPTLNVALLTKYLSTEFETLLVSGMKDESEASSEFILEEKGIEPLYIKSMMREISLFKDIRAFYDLVKIIKQFKPSIVHTHAAKAGTVGRLAASYCKVPIIIHTFHGHVFDGYFSPFKSNLFLWIERFLAKKTTAIIAISENQLVDLTTKYKIAPPNKFRCISLGFELNKFNDDKENKRRIFRNQYFIKDDEIVITIVGRLVPIKNHILFLDAINALKKLTNKKYKALIVGDGELRESLIDYCKSLNLISSYKDNIAHNSDVIFTSWRKDIDVVNAGSDIIALTSNNEGTPVSLIEAQASGKPIVSTKVGGIENIVTNRTAILTAPKNVKQFSEALAKIINDNQLRIQMQLEGWEYVKNKFNYTRLVKDIGNLYRELLK